MNGASEKGRGKRVTSRHGTLGVCAACQQPIPSHFTANWHWIGCASPATRPVVFVLVPVPVPECDHLPPLDDSHPAPVLPPETPKPVESEPVKKTPKRKSPTKKQTREESLVRNGGRKRLFMRAAYRATLPKDATVESLENLSPNRRRVLEAVVHLNEVSLIQPMTRDIIGMTGLQRGVVSEALVWLRARSLIVAKNMDEARFQTS
jgi:hypothetical protein